MNPDNFEDMATRWPSTIIARVEVKNFTGGGISAKTLANADSKGTGPKERFLMGRRICYNVSSLVEWLTQNMKKVKHVEEVSKQTEKPTPIEE
jgi:hypothetical protein